MLNIYQEIENEFGYDMPKDYGYLMSWANQGVLLLNTVLTVRENNPQSHKNCGWEIFTDKVIELLNERPEPIVFLLWGSNAKNKKPLITNKNHFLLSFPEILSAISLNTGAQSVADEFPSSLKTTITYSGFSDG